MKKQILIGILLIMGVSLVLNGCTEVNRTEPYIKSHSLKPEIVTPNQDFTLTFVVYNPSEFDKNLFLEIEVSNNIRRINAPTNRVTLTPLHKKSSQSYYNTFRAEETDETEEITLKLYSKEESEEPVDVKKVPIVVAIEARNR